jgi:hypothetical protein
VAFERKMSEDLPYLRPKELLIYLTHRISNAPTHHPRRGVRHARHLSEPFSWDKPQIAPHQPAIAVNAFNLLQYSPSLSLLFNNLKKWTQSGERRVGLAVPRFQLLVFIRGKGGWVLK